jgi:hypothetical protein
VAQPVQKVGAGTTPRQYATFFATLRRSAVFNGAKPFAQTSDLVFRHV